jgi:hypothetical protein
MQKHVLVLTTSPQRCPDQVRAAWSWPYSGLKALARNPNTGTLDCCASFNEATSTRKLRNTSGNILPMMLNPNGQRGRCAP